MRTGQREPKARRRGRAPQSRHSFETCRNFALYEKQVRGSRSIYDVRGFARHLYLSGLQDEEIDIWLGEQAATA